MAVKKNPTAVLIGQRIKQAREMAGMDSAAKLREHIPEWGPSRLGNYEAGISTPSPDDVETIARATGASPCWIVFGLGPIRATGRDPQAIRHQNLVYLAEDARQRPGQLNRLLKAIGLSRKKLEDHLNTPALKIPDRITRKCEQYLEKSFGWMDEQHVESDPLWAAFPEDMRHIMQVYSDLPQDKRKLFVTLADALAASESG